MAWSSVSGSPTNPGLVRDDNMDEIREMITEKNLALSDVCLRQSIALPSDIAAGDTLGQMDEYQAAFVDLINSTPTYRNHFADTEGNDFLTFISGSDDAGYKNVFWRAGVASGDFSHDSNDAVHKLHVNEFRDVGDLLYRLKLTAVQPEVSQGYGGAWEDPAFAVARSGAFADLSLDKASAAPFTPWLGRHCFVDPFDTDFIFSICRTKATCVFDTTGLDGYTVADAWLVVQYVVPIQADANTHTSSFDVGVFVGGNNAGTIDSNQASDIDDFSFPWLGTAGAWKFDVTPAWITKTGDTVVDFVFPDTTPPFVESDDSSWTDIGKDYYQCFGENNQIPANEPLVCLIVELELEYSA